MAYTKFLTQPERVFEDIKKLLKNRIFRRLEELEEAICQIVRTFTSSMLRGLTFYPYIKEAIGNF